MTADTAEREDFEKWAKPEFMTLERHGESYRHSPAAFAWAAWEARAALPARALEGWVAVPQAMIDWLLDDGPGRDGQWINYGEQYNPDPIWWRKELRDWLSAAPPPPEQKEEKPKLEIDKEALLERSCDDQFRLASELAANVGYVLVPEPEFPDSPHREKSAASPASGPAEPVARALELVDTIAAIIDERAFDSAARWHNGNTRSRRRNNARVRAKRILSALQPPQPAPAPVAAQPQPSAEVVKDWRENDLDIVILSERRNAAAAMRERCANAATSFLVGDPANGVPLRSPGPHEIAKAIRALPLDGEG